MMRIASWNVNGVRAARKKGLYEWLRSEQPDVLFLQETKAQIDQLDEETLNVPGYHSFWMSAERKGYSGVAAYTRIEPERVAALGSEAFDVEGRTCVLELPELTLLGCYFPNSRPEGARLSYKLDYCSAVEALCADLAAEERSYVVCGDFNIAHRPIDLARPTQNGGNPGYLPEERAWMDRFVAAGHIDTFRLFCEEGGHYTWWSYIGRAREQNIGWRLDYHCVPTYMRPVVRSSRILSDVFGSDHCPVVLELDI